MRISRHILLGAFLAGCSVGGEAGHPAGSAPAPTSATPAKTAASTAEPVAEDPPPADWRAAARRLDWDRAHELLSELPDEQHEKPEIRLAIGRAALGAGEHEAAVKALDGLAEELPLAKKEIERWYAEAAAVAGPHAEAAAILAKSPKVRDLLAASQALVRAEKTKGARKLLDKAIERAARTRREADEARGHLLRARLAEKNDDAAVAISDYRWLVEERSGHAEAREALEALDRLEAPPPLDERLTLLHASTTKGNLDDTLEALQALAADDAHTAHQPAIAFARAKAIYRARDYSQAKVAFSTSLELGGPFAAEARYYRARATARSGEPDEALKQYEALFERHPKSRWAERAAYRKAELLALRGKHDEAAGAYARYLSRFGKSRHATDARFAQALALLESGKPERARKLYAGLKRDYRGWRRSSHAKHLEGVAAAAAGDEKAAKKLWLELLEEQPLTYPALVAHARLEALEHEPLPPVIGPPPKETAEPLSPSMPSAPALLSSLGLDLAAERRLRALEDDAVDAYDGRESEALCSLYAQLSGAQRRAQIANRAVSLEALMEPPSAADRWAWECIYPRPYADIVKRVEDERGIPHGLVHAMMRQESFFRTTVTSPAGARGLMQLMPSTAATASAEMGADFDPGDIVQPDVNVGIGAFYLGKLLDNFDGTVALAAASYNAGPNAVARWLESGQTELDRFVAMIPYRETRMYVQRVLSNFARYQYLAGGAEAVTPIDLSLPESYDIGDDAY